MANPTTNYGWPMPTATDLVTDLPADFAAFGQPVDTSLKALNPETTLGDIAYRSATANTNTRLGIGSTGNVLTVSGGVPVWAAPAGGGKVLQVVMGTTSTLTSNSTSTMADTTLTATITPTLATSKVLVLISQNGLIKTVANSQNAIRLRLMRDATSVATFAIYHLWTNSTLDLVGTSSFNYLDTPSTTSATTYKTQFQNENNGAQVKVQSDSVTSSIILLEIGA